MATLHIAERICKSPRMDHFSVLIPWCFGIIDILGNIMNGMTEKRSKAKVVEKLLGMGLVQDRKALHKKRGKGGGEGRGGAAQRKRRGRHGDKDDDSDGNCPDSDVSS